LYPLDCIYIKFDSYYFNFYLFWFWCFLKKKISISSLNILFHLIFILNLVLILLITIFYPLLNFFNFISYYFILFYFVCNSSPFFFLSLVSNCCRNDICLARGKKKRKKKRRLKVREGTSEWKEAEVRYFWSMWKSYVSMLLLARVSLTNLECYIRLLTYFIKILIKIFLDNFFYFIWIYFLNNLN